MGHFFLRRELRAVRFAIDELRKAIQKHSETIRAAEEAQEHTQCRREPMPVVVTLDDKTVSETTRQNQTQNTIQGAIRNWTMGAVLAASFYGAVAVLQ
jgi:hypothetical protein